MNLPSLRIGHMEALLEHPGDGVPDVVGGIEGFLDDSPLLIHHKGAGVGHPVPGRTFRDVGIQDAKLPDGCAVRIREQRVRDLKPFGKRRQRFHRIITDRIDLDAVLLKTGEVVLQLHELRLAIPSPGGTAVEQDKGLSSAIRLVPDELAMLVHECELRDGFSDCRPFGKVFAGRVAHVGQWIEHPLLLWV